MSGVLSGRPQRRGRPLAAHEGPDSMCDQREEAEQVGLVHAEGPEETQRWPRLPAQCKQKPKTFIFTVAR